MKQKRPVSHKSQKEVTATGSSTAMTTTKPPNGFSKAIRLGSKAKAGKVTGLIELSLDKGGGGGYRGQRRQRPGIPPEG